MVCKPYGQVCVSIIVDNDELLVESDPRGMVHITNRSTGETIVITWHMWKTIVCVGSKDLFGS